MDITVNKAIEFAHSNASTGGSESIKALITLADEVLLLRQVLVRAALSENDIEAPSLLLKGIVSLGAIDIMKERLRQITEEGHFPDADARYIQEELVDASICYLEANREYSETYGLDLWPWPADKFKPASRRENLVRAGALIAAEIDRINLSEATKMGNGHD